jgi:alkylation response protein AidB-like acyl-CoA dehydrogenase
MNAIEPDIIDDGHGFRTITRAGLRDTVAKYGFDRILRDPETPQDCLSLLRTLFQIGFRDLSLARLVEGHVDAVQIAARLGTDEQRGQLSVALAKGALLGVWNAPHPQHQLQIDNGRLLGGKSYASGAGILTHALVTADAGGPEQQLVLLDLQRQEPRIDISFWHPIGMKPTATHQVFWKGAKIEPNQWLGQAGDYEREPWFSAGALRFVAAQTGAISAIADETIADLRRRGRAHHSFQQMRLARMPVAQRSVMGCLEQAAIHIGGDTERLLAEVALVRAMTYSAGDEVITLAQQSIGLQGLMDDHPLSAKLTDLMVYLRQPGPDAQTAKVADAFASGILPLSWTRT